MFLMNYDRVITHKGASLILSEKMMKQAANVLGVSVEEIREATEKFWPTATITKSKEGSHPSSGLEERLKLKAIAKGK
ncbi:MULTISPECIES: hypothetical protein [Enterobacteriaceae]|uniref:Uncharacterized protein n=4 Tax=Enterobacteriaceae TaxID=543 RepID=A0AAP9QGI0_CITFR|nr:MULTISPECIES: hypothetical protein [Enterobacteriaceae]EBL5610343.1 hypothetical protein [Salmonella enterica subsp. enterica serovar Typhimurium]EUM47538.1 hypothetical protein L379_03885 [Enterobacter sp. MGH 33]KDF44139.1 hypothetical protein AE07_03080 [Enterobacter cloacae BWH 43]HCC2747171.1 hypothetical protein [Klebsiella quasipneumoniae]HCJ6270643.1 hypothetical protein [Enterobacter hormaechei subsp. xiangfangensis]HED2544351.1 hypothetical protein [Raoultella planticola]